MSILSAMQSAAIRLVGQKPAVFFTSSDVFEQEITDLVNEVAKDICKYNDWQALTKIYNLPSDGVTQAFDLPADYDRQLVVTDIQDLNNWVWGYEHATNINEFLYYKARGPQITPGAWIMYNNQLNFYPAPVAANTATFPYISKNYALDSNNSGKSEFTADTDNFIINGGEDLLTLGLVWRWRENKKLDYTGDQEAFTMRADQLAAKDKGSNVYRDRSRTRFLNTRIAWPFTLGGI